MTASIDLKKRFGINPENLTLWGISIGHFFVHWFPGTFYLVLPLLKDEFGLSYTEMGFLITVRYIVGTLTNVPSGMLADLLRRHILIMTIALFLVGIPYFLVGISTRYSILLICMGIIGVGGNLWHPSAISALRDGYPQKRGWAIGWHSSAANIGDAMGPFISGFLLAWITWRQILTGSSSIGILIGLSFWWLLRKRLHASAGVAPGENIKNNSAEKKRMSIGEYLIAFGRLLINPNVFVLSLINGIRSFTQNGLNTFLPSFFMNLMQLSPWLSGIYMTILQAAGIVAAPISGRVSDLYGRKKVVTAALFATSFAIFLLSVLNIPWLFVVFLGITGFFLYSLRPVLVAWTMEAAPHEMGGSAVGVQFSFQSAFNTLSPLLGGWIADTWGLMYTFYLLAAMLLLSNLLVVFVREPDQSPDDQNTPAS